MNSSESIGEWAKKNFDEAVATLTQELTEAKTIAEGRAAWLQQAFAKTPGLLGSVSEQYDQAAGKYNGVCAYLEVMLSTNQRPTAVPKLDDARSAYQAFVDSATALSAQTLQSAQFASLAIPSAGDIFQGVDVILRAIEWFKERHEKERLRIVDALKRTEWNNWANAGTTAIGNLPKTAKAGASPFPTE